MSEHMLNIVLPEFRENLHQLQKCSLLLFRKLLSLLDSFLFQIFLLDNEFDLILLWRYWEIEYFRNIFAMSEVRLFVNNKV